MAASKQALGDHGSYEAVTQVVARVVTLAEHTSLSRSDDMMSLFRLQDAEVVLLACGIICIADCG